MGYGIIRDEPITIEVKNGEVDRISGGAAAEYLESTLASFNDRSAYNLAEFAVGLNPEARGYATNLEGLGKLFDRLHDKQRDSGADYKRTLITIGKALRGAAL